MNVGRYDALRRQALPYGGVGGGRYGNGWSVAASVGGGELER